jgi:hypothetical protein
MTSSSTRTATPDVDDVRDVATVPVTVDDLSEWSFPASDPPATWTWDPEMTPA